MKTTQEIDKTGNLYQICVGLVDALDHIGNGLQAIAVALSTPEENTAEVKQLTEHVASLRQTLELALSKGEKPNG